ncbi:MDR family MFS transporter [Plantactinospora sp. B5E13]|uniref:MDR family MFS transporter n=1 Tax=Plantactinospora sp. B5E13 TaxID=3153758 RepID=UPI00325E4C03
MGGHGVTEQEPRRRAAGDAEAGHEPPDGGSTPPERLDPALLKIAGVVLVGAVAALLDTTIISVALNQLGEAFGVPVSTVQWVSTAYLLAMALVIPLTGWCVDRFGARVTWLWVLAVFLAGSVLCGAAWSAGSLITFRVVQGLGAGMILPLTQIILAQAAGGRGFGRVMALVAVPGNLIPIVGPVLGGVVLNVVSWRWIFLINVPVCLLAIVLARRALPTTPGHGRQRLDVLGLALLAPAVPAMIYGLSQVGGSSALTAAGVVVPVVIGFVLLAAFTTYALRVTRTPVIDLRLFRYRSFSASAALLFLSGAALYGPLFLLPLYYQQVRGFDAFTTGLVLAPQGVGTALALAVIGPLADRIGARPLVLAGALVTALGTLAYTQVASGPDDVLLAVALVLRGVGLGAVGIPVMAAAYQQLPHSAIAHGTSAMNILQRLGASFGTAVIAVILQQRLDEHGIGDVTAGVRPESFVGAFWWTVGSAVLILPLALLLPGRERAVMRR